MKASAWLGLPQKAGTSTILSGINKRLSACSLSITLEDAQMLARRRTESLAETERVEFAEPAIMSIAEAFIGSPYLTQDSVASNLAKLQDAFYALRDELPIDVPDGEIVEALRGCLDAWGDAATVASMPVDEIMGYSKEYVRASQANAEAAYRITDDEGRTYSFDPQEWAYDEQADGWDGERWSDGWDD